MARLGAAARKTDEDCTDYDGALSHKRTIHPTEPAYQLAERVASGSLSRGCAAQPGIVSVESTTARPR